MPDYRAGQYLALEVDVLDDGVQQRLLYSIAGCRGDEHHRWLQLFIEVKSPFTAALIKRLGDLAAKDESLSVTLPMGKAYLQTDLSLPHLLIASGSGISKIRCLTEEILNRRPDADISVYWSNKCVDDFYLADEIRDWERRGKRLRFTPILASEAAGWSGRQGLIYQVIRNDLPDLSQYQTYLCGSPNMVFGTLDKLADDGLRTENCYSDVFEYASRGA